jgi:hypothetical protein
MAEAFDWVKPSLLWRADAQDFRAPDFFQPRLLEFRSDNFMDDFLSAAGAEDSTALQSLALTRPAGATVKLFQPIHGRYYLVCGSLCCRLTGFPDREVKRADSESVFFVLRKKIDGVEHGWVVREDQKGWRQVGERPVLDDEERLPMFPAMTKKGRTLLFGYVPVASRDTYAAPPSQSPIDQSVDPSFIDPVKDMIPDATHDPDAKRLSVYLLLDLWEYLNEQLSDVAAALRDDTTGVLSGAKRALTDYLQSQALSGGVTLRSALRDVALARDSLNALAEGALPSQFNNNNYQLRGKNYDALNVKVKDALDPARPNVEVPKLSPVAGDRFALRLVYERGQCDPPELFVSQASVEFQLAPFFDPEAPARQIRIGLPTDVSIGGFRQIKKGVSFMMSNALRNKLESVNKDMLKGDPPGAEGGFTLGHICSFSIPIITLCAFILLLIIVIVLNLIFFWVPFLKICLPLNLKSR